MKWIQEAELKKDVFLNKLIDFLEIPSVLDDSTATKDAPFGKSINDALQFMLELGKSDGFTVKNLDGYAGHIEYGAGEEIVGILTHIDVVPATEGWTSPPFSPEIRSGKLYARGATDDKGPTMASYFALKIIKELGLPLSKRVRLILGTDEETHWRCMDYYLKHEETPTVGFTPDAEFPIITAEKGFLDVQFSGPLKEGNDSSEWILQKFESGQRVNMVPEYATAILGGSGDVFELKEAYQDFLMKHHIEGYAEEADEHLKLVLHGRAHHGSEPEKGLSAALELARFLVALQLDGQGHQYVQMINDCFIDGIFGEKLDMVTEDNIVGKLTVNVGVYRYVLGKEQYIRVNVRYPIHADGKQLIEQLKEKITPFGLEATSVDNKPGHSFDNNHPLVQTLARVYEEQTGKPSQSLAVAGATYARALPTCVAYGPIFPGKVETAHQTDEYIDVDDLIRAIAIYAQAIYELAK
ncbi:dipeptidase PepV [Shimazuella alba]|uniref:Dipeptidase PepV n=1 Tax=Shimazuella alba TaxID=2690964 RepID=A0A6I4VTK1_9BACL|nr:dipeptidase PepV [Shimazuella alba]MXQ53828.1 dipeptidase PepV [Shimazuella alba]